MKKNKTVIVILGVIIAGLIAYIVLGKNIPAPAVVSPEASVENQPVTPVVTTEKSPVNSKPAVPSKKDIQVYAEPDTGGDPILGPGGKQMRVIVSTAFPATLTYTLKYSYTTSYPVFNESHDQVTTETVSVKAGKTILDTVMATDGTIGITFDYVDNTGKASSAIKPAVKVDTKLYSMGVGGLPYDEVRRYDFISQSNTTASVTYTIEYTDENAGKKTIAKTVTVPLGKSTVESIMSTTNPTLDYKVN
jgi:hypothetical protein